MGQILLALRAHDQRIEENLADLLQLYLPKAPEEVHTFIGIAKGENKRIQYWIHEGAPGDAQEAVEQVLKGAGPRASSFIPLPESMESDLPEPLPLRVVKEHKAPYQVGAPTMVLTGKLNDDGSFDLRTDTVARDKPDADGTPGTINIRRTKAKAKGMINKDEGNPLPSLAEKKRKRAKDDQRAIERQLRLLKEMQEFGEAIRMNLLDKSGLYGRPRPPGPEHPGGERKGGCPPPERRRVTPRPGPPLWARQPEGERPQQAGRRMHHRGTADDERRHAPSAHRQRPLALRRERPGGGQEATSTWCAGSAESGTGSCATTSGPYSTRRSKPSRQSRTRASWRDWNAPCATSQPRPNALRRPTPTWALTTQALSSTKSWATRPATAHISPGPWPRPSPPGSPSMPAATWTGPIPAVWRAHKTLDLACGSGTLLAATLTDMKRRAKEEGADEDQLAALQKLAVEETIKGLDINPVSLQLAASQLTAGNHNISYRQMGLHLMPYGPQPHDPGRVAVGTLELLGQKAVVERSNELGLADDRIASQATWRRADDTELEDAVSAVKDARIIIMNPPFTNRAKMGEKFPKETQRLLRARADAMERTLVRNDRDLEDFVDKNALEPLFTALADRCLIDTNGVLAMINPTVALCATSALEKRRVLAQRFHIHTVLTGRLPREFALSQNTEIDESIIVAKRHNGPKTPTRFIHLDRMPIDESEVDDLHRCLMNVHNGRISNGWGEVSEWPAERIEAGDWTPAIWRSPELAEAAARYANHADLLAINTVSGLSVHATGQILRGSFERAVHGTPGSFPILKSKGSEGQMVIQSRPDEHWVPKNRGGNRRQLNGGTQSDADRILEKAGYLLITTGHRTSTARLTATADDERYVGNGWMPVAGLTSTEAKGLAVFINSTPGRLQLMRNPGRQIPFPTYSAAEAGNIRIPDTKDARIRDILADCWERTKDTEVPQFRDGECEVHCLWDEAVAEAMGWEAGELARLRELLNNEPHVRGLGYNQYADEIDAESGGPGLTPGATRR